MRSFVLAAVALAFVGILTPRAQSSRPPLAPADVDAIVRLVALEDTRQFDRETLGTLVRSTHPEVRRRAIVAVGRIVNPGGPALLADLRRDPDQEIVATVAFATGQLKDPDAVPWLSQSLTGPAPVAFEAARALGKIRTPAAWSALSQYLASATLTPANAAAIGEALLSIGRFTERQDVAPIVRWTTSQSEEVRWRAAWALFRPRNPAAVTHLLKLTDDPVSRGPVLGDARVDAGARHRSRPRAGTDRRPPSQRRPRRRSPRAHGSAALACSLR